MYENEHVIFCGTWDEAEAECKKKLRGEPSPVAKATRARRGKWSRESAPGDKACTWRHDSGWLLIGGGHPTALNQIYAVRPDGETIVWAVSGRGFRNLGHAFGELEELHGVMKS